MTFDFKEGDQITWKGILGANHCGLVLGIDSYDKVVRLSEMIVSKFGQVGFNQTRRNFSELQKAEILAIKNEVLELPQ